MNYCQFRNLTIKRMTHAGGGILPAEYQQVEYLQSAGGTTTNDYANAHINTGLTYFADFEIVCMRVNNNGTKFCGVQPATCLQRSGADGKFAFYNAGSSYYNSTYSILTKTKIAWRNDKIYIDDVYIRDFVKSTSTTGAFHLYGTGGTTVTHYNDIRVYSFRAWDTAGNMIRDMYPCYRKSDNVTGFYDLQNSFFYTKAGTTGRLDAGPDVL